MDSNDAFKELDLFLCGLEFDDKPNIEKVVVTSTDNVYNYIPCNEHDKWYLVTEGA